MYEEFFGFKANPFKLAPNPQYFFQSKVHRRAFAGLYYGLVQEQGILVLTGPVGTGKTTLIEVLAIDLEKLGEYRFVHLTYAPSAEEIIKAVATEVTQEEGFEENSQAIRSLKKFLLQERKQRKFVLVVDEAQNLSLKALEELRMLSNLETPQEKLLPTVLVGQPGLEEKLANPALSQLKQRITTHSLLSPLLPEEIPGYLEYRIKIAGFFGDLYSLFTEEAVQLISHCSQGIPRLINSICHEALTYGYATGERRITLDFVKEAAESLKLLPEAKVMSKEEQMKPLQIVTHKEEIRETKFELPQEGNDFTAGGFKAPSEREFDEEALEIKSSFFVYMNLLDARLKKVESEVERLLNLVSQVKSQEQESEAFPDKMRQVATKKKDESQTQELKVPAAKETNSSNRREIKSTKRYKAAIFGLISLILVLLLGLLFFKYGRGLTKIGTSLKPETILSKGHSKEVGTSSEAAEDTQKPSKEETLQARIDGIPQTKGSSKEMGVGGEVTEGTKKVAEEETPRAKIIEETPETQLTKTEDVRESSRPSTSTELGEVSTNSQSNEEKEKIQQLSFQEPPLTLTVTVFMANIRGGPGIRYPILSVAKGGELLEGFGEEYRNWIKVKTQNRGEGWISKELVREIAEY